jgi:putative inorganic carbon (HCO3(-)) transporter
MRGYFVLAIILGSLPFCFLEPYFGVLMWSWVGYFSPHRYTYGYAYHFPVAMVIAVPTLAGLIFTKKLNKGIFTREAIVLAMLWIWMAITLGYASAEPKFAGHVQEGIAQFERISKILLMAWVSILVVNSKKRMKYLYLVTAISFGLLAIKAVAFGLKTSGGSRVWGPPDSFITDNNDMALALNMSLPILFFLARDEENPRLRLFLRFMFVCSIASVILTYSRGGLLGLAAVILYLAVYSRRKVLAGVMLVSSVLLVFTFAPTKWMDRMETIRQGSLDETAKERIVTWGFAWNLAQDYPITGGGLQAFPDVPLFQAYQPEPLPGGYQAASAHSIYFQMLGEHGFVGLGLFLLLLGFTWSATRAIRKRAVLVPSIRWMIPYSHMLEASLIAFMVCGAFLGRPYFDLFYQLIASVVVLKIMCRREISALRQARHERIEVTPEMELAST